MAENSENPSVPVGWHFDEDTGALVRDTIHRMGRRCFNWDYCGRGAYQVTMVLADRKAQLFGELRYSEVKGAYVELSTIGREIETMAWNFSAFTSEIEILGVCVMPDHLHIVLRVARRLPEKKPLGIAIRGFKGGATKAYWRHLGYTPAISGGAQAPRLKSRGVCCPGPLFAEGFVDTILFDEAAVSQELGYLADNARRLWEKRAHPELFRVLRGLPVELATGWTGHFAAIGNHALLFARTILQVQCSRRYFAYRRNARDKLLKDEPPAVASPEFIEKRDTLLAAAAHGAVLVSPCISEGEREIARLAFKAGHRVITLSNKGFSPLYKPGGKLFDTCAAGNLLMLAPAGWPYLPGEKKMTRQDACVLNYLAQKIAGKGAVEIIYKGVQPARVDELAHEVVSGQ